MKNIGVVFISLSELPVVKDQDFKIVSFTTNHGLGKQSQYSLWSPFPGWSVESLSIYSTNVFLKISIWDIFFHA